MDRTREGIERREQLVMYRFLYYWATQHGGLIPSASWEALGECVGERRVTHVLGIVRSLKTRGVLEADLGWDGLFNVRPLMDLSELEALLMDRVFVVHGHDFALKEQVARFLERGGLTAVILHEQPSGGRSILQKVDHFADVKFAVVLLTPDDIGGKANEPDVLRPRARQNVVLELGFFLGRLGLTNVHCLYLGDVEIPTDYSGIVYTRVDPTSDSWKQELVRELRHAGLHVDVHKALGI